MGEPMTAGSITMQVLWERVRSREEVALIERLRAVYGRKTRKERRLFAKLSRKAVRMGLLATVVTDELPTPEQ